MIRLATNLPELWGELCEVVRLFLGAVEISANEGERLIEHVHAEREGLWVERFTADGR